MEKIDLKHLVIALAFLLCGACGYSSGEDTTPGFIARGNLALPTSQMPGPLFGFGQNIVDKGDLQAFLFADSLRGQHKSLTEAGLTMLYGCSQRVSLFVGLPYALKFRSDCHIARGMEDGFAQVEYAAYVAQKPTSSDQITLVANMSLPFGDADKNPATGLGVPSFFVGLTASHMSVDWYIFGALGGLFPVRLVQNGGMPFNQLVYQGGFAKNFGNPRGLIVTGIVELLGQHNGGSLLRGHAGAGSIESQFLIAPSLFISSERWLVQIGIAGVVVQQVTGQQHKDKWWPLVNIGWKFDT